MNSSRLSILLVIAVLASVGANPVVAAQPTSTPASALVTHYRTATVDGVSIFYREAGPANGPVVLLLHGFPTSSHMFRNLIPDSRRPLPHYSTRLSRFRGQSAAPDRTQFAYSFGHYAEIVDGLMRKVEAKSDTRCT